jgi:glycosyltransferase 2 family protein
MKHLSPRLLWLVLLALLLWWALQNAPLAEIGASLQLLQLWQLGALLGLNTAIFALITARWWLIVRADARHVPFLPLVAYRLAAFGMSYFTPGPQVGGEPLQILYLQKSYGLTAVRATSAVIMDKLLEFLANFLFLAIGLFMVAQSGMLAQLTPPGWTVIPLALILLWPLVHILLMVRGIHPLSIVLAPVKAFLSADFTDYADFSLKFLRNLRMKLLNFIRLIIVSERFAARFCRRHLLALLAALSVSLLSWAGMVLEYLWMLDFLAAPLTFPQALAALTVVRLSFLAPLPAGLGALEASQVFAATAFGLPAALGISLALLMRGRDILLGGLGLLIAALKK